MQTRTPASLISFLSVIGFFAIFSTTISKNPVLPLFAVSLGSDEALLGLIAAVSPAAGILFSFPVGMMADRIRPKRLLVISGLILVSAPLLYLFVTQPLALIPVRFFHGLATAILGPVAAMMIFAAYPDARGEKSGIYSSATLVGRTLAPLIGGILISLCAASAGLMGYRLVYLAAFFLSVPALVLILTLDDSAFRTPPRNTSGALTPRDFLTGITGFTGDRRLLSTAIVEMGVYFAFGAFETYLPLYLINAGFPAYLIGILFAVQVVAIAISKPAFGAVSDKIDRRAQILAGICMIGVCIALIPFLDTFLPLLLIGLVFGLGMAVTTVSTGAYIADVSREQDLGASVGALSSIMDIGHSTGPLVTGIIIVSAGFAWGFLTSALLMLFVGLYFMRSVYTGRIS